MRRTAWIFALWLIVSHGAWARPQPHSPSAGVTLQVPVTGKALGPDGTVYTITTVIPIQIEAPAPPVDPLAVTGLTISPGTVVQGGTATGTITLNRAPLADAAVALSALEQGLTLPATALVPAGQTKGTFTILTSAAPNITFWYSLRASYNASVKTAAVLVTARSIPLPPPPPPPGEVLPPKVNSHTNADGSPLVGPVVYGQEVVFKGTGFGAAPGKVLWNGMQPLPVLAWSDTLVRVRLPLPVYQGAAQFWLQRSLDGVWISDDVGPR